MTNHRAVDVPFPHFGGQEQRAVRDNAHILEIDVQLISLDFDAQEVLGQIKRQEFGRGLQSDLRADFLDLLVDFSQRGLKNEFFRNFDFWLIFGVFWPLLTDLISFGSGSSTVNPFSRRIFSL